MPGQSLAHLIRGPCVSDFADGEGVFIEKLHSYLRFASHSS
jgi:hypothetical protein